MKMTDKITQPADAADGKAENNATTSADGARDDGGERGLRVRLVEGRLGERDEQIRHLRVGDDVASGIGANHWKY